MTCIIFQNDLYFSQVQQREVWTLCSRIYFFRPSPPQDRSAMRCHENHNIWPFFVKGGDAGYDGEPQRISFSCPKKYGGFGVPGTDSCPSLSPNSERASARKEGQTDQHKKRGPASTHNGERAHTCAPHIYNWTLQMMHRRRLAKPHSNNGQWEAKRRLLTGFRPIGCLGCPKPHVLWWMELPIQLHCTLSTRFVLHI